MNEQIIKCLRHNTITTITIQAFILIERTIEPFIININGNNSNLGLNTESNLLCYLFSYS